MIPNRLQTVDQLQSARASAFSTADRGLAVHCARQWMSGWWYNPVQCAHGSLGGRVPSLFTHSAGNLNTPYDIDLADTRLLGVQWPTDNGYVRIRSVQMKIRPIGYVSPLATVR